MPLTTYERDGWWWFKGRIDNLPGSKYNRQSTGIPSTAPEAEALKVVADYQAREIKRHYVGEEKSLTFSEAVMMYKAHDMEASDLARILPLIGDRPVAEITPQ